MARLSKILLSEPFFLLSFTRKFDANYILSLSTVSLYEYLRETEICNHQSEAKVGSIRWRG